MRATWNNIDPKLKRYAVVAIMAGLFVGLIALFSGPSETTPKRSRNDTIRHVLTDRDTRTVGLESLSASMKSLESDNTRLNRELERLKNEAPKKNQNTPDVTEITDRMARLEQTIQKLEKKEKTEKTEAKKDAEQAEEPSPAQSAPPPVNLDDPASLFKHRHFPVTGGSSAPGRARDAGGERAAPSKREIMTYVADAPKSASEAQPEKDSGMYLPAGSIITGVFINGIDAPTGQAARRDPFPAALRIQKEAILPNRFRADVRECFLLVSGYGDMSSERAYLRGETVSCVREDGGVIEARLDSYAVGEDGKAGVRGRLVNKQGQLLARSLMAGFMQGVASAFDVQKVPSINITRSMGGSSSSGGSKTQSPVYEQAFNSNAMQAAAVGGVGSALERIADYYLSMAENIFPVIEVDAGRQIDIIVTHGASLSIKSKG
ncbi:TraB/VirB10 family protein [Azomonas macrocytogenes]|uniref:Conjugal transfer pilus assembly protein TraB n=1 Tax=Azomonas macrocytogenes TaxID=69962 RepID=A0A839T895_AZOMA|nr:TraB/VirB10 family protein [Azomonas macrocytogenes]MBB3105329.1 conjugal transfer pilus assembly protein TraB [Azomonas macrocytogenes]